VTEAAARLLAVEQADAWFEYGETCRQARDYDSRVRYDDVEPWAWRRLQERLRAVHTRELRLERAHRPTTAAAA